MKAKVRPLSSFKAEDQKDIMAVNAYKAGNKEAFTQIWDRYRPFFLQKITLMVKRRDIAEDCVMDIMEKVLMNLDKYQPTYTFNAWINFLAKNYMIDFSRKSQWKSQMNDVSIDNVFDNEDGNENSFANSLSDPSAVTDEHIQKEQESQAIQQALATLGDQERVIVAMIYAKQMKYDEVSKAEGIPVGTVKAVLFRAKRKIAEVITRLHPEIANHYREIARPIPYDDFIKVTSKLVMVDGESMLEYHL